MSFFLKKRFRQLRVGAGATPKYRLPVTLNDNPPVTGYHGHRSQYELACIRHVQRVLALEETGPGGVQPVLVVGLGLLCRLLEGVLADLLVFVNDRVHLLLGYGALVD